MARFQGKRVSRQWNSVLNQAHREGVRFTLNSGRRTMGEQWALFRQNMIRPGVPRPGHPLTAVPSPFAPHIRVGRQDHALDVDSLDGGETRLQRWLRHKGLDARNTVRGESWHLEVPAGQLWRFAKRIRRGPEAGAPMKAADLKYAFRARRHGAHYARRIIEEARRENVRLSLAFAICEQETGFRNVYGHDPVRNPAPKGGKVTRRNYSTYKRNRQHGLGMQGVGPMQLTWWETQNLADREGGCWRPRINIRIGLRALHDNMRRLGAFNGIAAYNGSGDAARRYAAQVEQRQQKWHRILTGGKA